MPNINIRRRILKGKDAIIFSPLDIPNLRLWLDAADISTLDQNSPVSAPVTTTGQPVGTIGDKSGNNFDFVQPTLAKKATYRDSGLLSPTIESDGVDDFYFGDPTTWDTLLDNNDDFSFFSALAPDNTSTSKGLVLASSNNILSLHIPLNSTRIFIHGAGQLFNVATTQIPPFTYNVTATDIDPLLVATATAYINDLEIASGSGLRSALDQGTDLVRIGSDTGGAGRPFFSGCISEIIIYNTILTDVQRSVVLQYLINKWGI